MSSPQDTQTEPFCVIRESSDQESPRQMDAERWVIKARGCQQPQETRPQLPLRGVMGSQKAIQEAADKAIVPAACMLCKMFGNSGSSINKATGCCDQCEGASGFDISCPSLLASATSATNDGESRNPGPHIEQRSQDTHRPRPNPSSYGSTDLRLSSSLSETSRRRLVHPLPPATGPSVAHVQKESTHGASEDAERFLAGIGGWSRAPVDRPSLPQAPNQAVGDLLEHAEAWMSWKLKLISCPGGREAREECSTIFAGVSETTSGPKAPSTYPTKTGRKHKIGQDDAGNDSDGDDDALGPKKRRQPNRGNGRPKLACPFYKSNPRKYQRQPPCSGPGWDIVSRVKEHLRRNHAPDEFTCRRCSREFTGNAELQAHYTAPDPCETKETQALDRLTRAQFDQLMSEKKSRETQPEKWRRMYRVIFPNVLEERIPSSPFYEDGDLILPFIDYVQRESRPMTRPLEEPEQNISSERRSEIHENCFRMLPELLRRWQAGDAEGSYETAEAGRAEERACRGTHVTAADTTEPLAPVMAASSIQIEGASSGHDAASHQTGIPNGLRGRNQQWPPPWMQPMGVAAERWAITDAQLASSALGTAMAASSTHVWGAGSGGDAAYHETASQNGLQGRIQQWQPLWTEPMGAVAEPWAIPNGPLLPPALGGGGEVMPASYFDDATRDFDGN